MDVRKLFEIWFKKEFEWEMKRGLHLRYDESENRYIHVETRKYFKSFEAAMKIMGEINAGW